MILYWQVSVVMAKEGRDDGLVLSLHIITPFFTIILLSTDHGQSYDITTNISTALQAFMQF